MTGNKSRRATFEFTSELNAGVRKGLFYLEMGVTAVEGEGGGGGLLTLELD